MSEWMPIESAPKDGTKFLAWRDHEVAEAYVIQRDDGEVWTFGRTSAHVSVFPSNKPTHWQPLPAPPKEL